MNHSENHLRSQMPVGLLASVLLSSCSVEPAHDRQTTASSTTITVTASSTASSTTPLFRSVPDDKSTASALVPLTSYDSRQMPDTALYAPMLQCSPAVFSRRDTITLHIDAPHTYLMVTRPDSVSFSLTYPQPQEPPNYMLVPSDMFANMPVIRFRADIRATPAMYGRDTLETVFDLPGKYVIQIGEKFGTDYDDDVDPEAAGIFHRCTIRHVVEK